EREPGGGARGDRGEHGPPGGGARRGLLRRAAHGYENIERPGTRPGHDRKRGSSPMTNPYPDPGPAEQAARAPLGRIRGEVAKAVVGQDAAVSGLVIGLLCRGHVLLEGVPGVAKTLLVRSLAAALDLETKRVQFTPDLMPGDVTGSLVYDNHIADFSFRPGPIFTNLLLADE